MDEKETLHSYLRIRRDDLLRKLDGLGEYDVRRPMTPTGTNLLGLVKHVASVQVGYFGETFGRPFDFPMPWYDDGAEPDADMWVPASESRADILDLWQRSNAHTDATIEALPLDAVGHVPWWPPEREQVTLHQILVHMAVETARHAGHADIVREGIDGAIGNGPGDPNIPGKTGDDWAAYCARIDAAAREAAAEAR
ncbi:DinB family protein [Cellulomonas sp.]|uniref:DinB family protein n=1 Tax=Cellulomonas sp. TaxID=40001 RepID=UPI001B08C10B|nr:DinB family protein [Cellulomonas sp.]MBO9554590.1 DinB family protein [Cellulomonas sp.]